MKPVIIIPAYKPDGVLLTLVKALLDQQMTIIVINDGSGNAYLPLFSSLEKIENVKVLHHDHNRGKGQALKTAFAYFVNHYPMDCIGVVTADADGQHLPKDILSVAQRLEQDPNALWLGARSFEETVPWRSRFGNVLTRTIFRVLVGQALQDTQTGLRGIPREFLHILLQRGSNGYDFELDMLLCS